MSKMDQTQDMQALQLGIQSTTSARAQFVAGTFTSTSTSGTAKTATTGYTATATNDLAGMVVVANTNATWASGTPIWGVVLKNTTGANSVLTIDQWYSFANPPVGGQTPAATSNFVVYPSTAPFFFMGLTTSVSAVTGTETGTQPGGTEQTSGGLQRTIATTFTHSAGADTATLGVTFTYDGSGGSKTIGRSFVANSLLANDNAVTANAGNFAFFIDQLNGATGYVVAANLDTLQVTYTVTLTTVP